MFSLVCTTRIPLFPLRHAPPLTSPVFLRSISVTTPVYLKKKKSPAPISKKKQLLKEKKKEQKMLADLQEKYTASSLPLLEAIRVLRAVEITRPNATYELNIQLHFGRGAMIPRGRIVFPTTVKHAKSDTILVFAEPRMAELSKAAGAEFAGGMELVDDVVSGKIRPSMVLATPALAKHISKPLGKVLGPLGLMPAERRGTVMDDPATHIMGIKESQQWSSDKDGVIRTAVAKTSFTDDDVVRNVEHLLQTVRNTITPNIVEKSVGSGSKPSVRFMRVMLSSQQGPGITLADVV